jgi:ABC-type molybdate transport system substrate-binding protein
MLRAMKATPAGLCFALSLASIANAAELHILAPTALQAAMEEAIRGYERQTHHHVIFQFGTVEATAEQALKDEKADAVIVPSAQMNALNKANRIVPDTRRNVGRVGDSLYVYAAMRGDHEDAMRALSAYLSFPETVAILSRRGIGTP